MRAAVLAGILAMTVAAADAKSPLAAPDVPFYLRLPSEAHLQASYAHQHDQSDSLDWRSADTAQSGSGMRFGPIHAEAVSDPRPGKHKTLMQYRLDGFQVMGGDIGGRLGAHGGMVTLHWNTTQ
jgi:hypothetical protein